MRDDIQRLRSVFLEGAPGVKKYDFGRSIVKSLETGIPISVVQVVVKQGKWVTVYPKE